MISAKLMRVVFLIAIVVLILLGASVVFAADIVNQGAGSNAVTPWKMRVVTSTGAPVDTFGAGGPAITAGAPAFSVAVTSVSAAATGLTAGASYRVACTSTVFFRTGSGTPVAVTTDAPIFGPAVEYMMLATGSTAFAFITATGTATCTGTLLSTP